MTSPDDDWGAHLDPFADAPEPAGSSGAALPPGGRQVVEAIRGRLRDETLWSDPPPGLRASLLARAAAEGRGGDLPALPTEPAADPHPASPASERSRRSPVRRRTPWLVAAAAAVILGGGAAVLWPRPDVTTFAAAGTPLAPQASAVVHLEPKSAGVAIRLDIKGLQPAPEGAYYAAWLRGPEGVVPVGTFHWRKGGIPIDLWSGVTADRYPELFVTLQREGAAPTPSDQVVLDGRA
jgi:hypothetical protein